MAEENVTLQVNFEGISSLKTELKAANDEYQKLINSGKATADQIDAAARKVGAFKDQIKEANERAQALGSAEGRIRAIGEAARVGVSAFQGYKAILELTGQDTKKFEETMRQLQAVMALQQAIQGLEGAADAFKNLWTIGVNAFKALRVAIGSTGIGLLVVGLGLIVANFEDIKKAAIDMFPALANLGTLFDNMKQGFMGVVNVVSKALGSGIFKTLGKLIQGDIQGALKELKNGFDITKNYTEGANKEKLRQEKEVQDETARIRAEAEAEQDKQNKTARAKIEAANKEKARLQKEANDKAAAQRAELEKAEQEHLNRMFELNATEQEKEKAKVNQYYSDLIKTYEKNKKDTTQLRKDQATELAKIDEEYRIKEEEARKEAQEKRVAREIDLYNRLKEAATKQINDKIDADRETYNNERLSFEERYAALDQELADINTKVWESEDEKTKAIKENSEARTKIELSEKEARTAIVMAYVDIASQVGELITQLAGKNKAAAIAGLVIEKAAAIAGIIQNTALANAKSVATFPITAGQPWVTINTISAGISIASVIAQSAKAISQINSTNTDSSSSGSSGSKFAKGGLLMGRKHAEGGIMTNLGELESGEFVVNREATSSFLPMLEKINSLGSGSGTPNNLSSTVETNQLYNGNPPIIKTYVVASDVTSQQEIQRKINNLARL